MAYTKAIVIEYWKPWSDNRNNPGLESAANCKHVKPLMQTAMHDALKELRNCVIAHADEAYEGRGIALIGTRVINDHPNLNPRTLPGTFVPVKLSVGSSRSFWWLEDSARMTQIRDHIALCEEAATQRIHTTTHHLLKVCLGHIHVLEHLGLFTFEELETTSPGQVTVPDSNQPPEVPKLEAPAALKLGDEYVQSLVTVYAPSAFISQGEFRGDGFILKVDPGPDSTSLRFSVAFPSRRPIKSDLETSDWTAQQAAGQLTRRRRRAAERPIRWADRCTQEKLLCDFRSSTATGTPQSTNDNFVLVESVVEMTVYLSQIQPTNANHIGFGIRRASSREEGKDSKGCFEFSRKDLGMDSVLKPPSLFSPDVLLRSRCELDATVPQRDLMSLRISSASTSLPAAASVSDWRRASWSAARSASSSQSPGSSGSRSISVPFGSSVGSSTTSRPSRTRALMVMKESVALSSAAQQALAADGPLPKTGARPEYILWRARR